MSRNHTRAGRPSEPTEHWWWRHLCLSDVLALSRENVCREFLPVKPIWRAYRGGKPSE